jgi:hypothetical protein
MPRLGPIKRKDRVRYLKEVGFEGPYSEGKHQFMMGAPPWVCPTRIEVTLDKNYLVRILRQAGIGGEI